MPDLLPDTEVAKSAAETTGQRYRVEAVSRAAQLLSVLRSGPQASLEQLAATAGTSEAFAEAALWTLARHDLVRRLPDGSWALGLVWLRLADVKRRQLNLREIAAPIMQRMRDSVDETVILAVCRGHRRVNIDYVESTQAIRRITQFGYEAPLHLGATGRALLSGLSADELGEFLAAVVTGMGRAAKLFDLERFQSEVAAVRQQGFASSQGEITPDTGSVSAPIFDHNGAVAAAFTISVPADRFAPGLRQACIQAVLAGAREASRHLGYVSVESA